MKRFAMSLMGLGTVLFFFSVSARAETADTWGNRPNVIAAAERLTVEIAVLDEALHVAKAPSHVVTAMHHMETTAGKLLADVQAMCTYAQGTAIFRHLHTDLYELQSELNYHSYLLNNAAVNRGWRRVRITYNNLDLELYMRDLTRWPAEKADSLRKEVEELGNW